MPATIVTTNLVQGPSDLWLAVFGTAEPADTVAALTGDPGAGWTYLGSTDDETTLTIAQGYTKMRVQQVPDAVGARMNERDFSVEVNLAEATLENLARVLNQLAATVVTGTGVKHMDLANVGTGDVPNYAALLIDGQAPQATNGTNKRRRVIVRKVLSTGDVEYAYSNEDKSVYSATFDGFFVSSSIKPVHIVDET